MTTLPPKASPDNCNRQRVVVDGVSGVEVEHGKSPVVDLPAVSGVLGSSSCCGISKIEAIKIATGIDRANCSTCHYLGSESDGGFPECSTSWPVCHKFPSYEFLKSFPFKKEMSCWHPDFWQSKFCEIRTGEDEEVLAKIREFKAAIEPHMDGEA